MSKVYAGIPGPLFRRWLSLRNTHLKAHPYCAMCYQDTGRLVVATHVDHKQPHKGDPVLLLNPSNLQSLCTIHHNASKQREERVGFSTACDINGMPLDPRHPWAKYRDEQPP